MWSVFGFEPGIMLGTCVCTGVFIKVHVLHLRLHVVSKCEGVHV